MTPSLESAAERYDYALRRARDSRLPAGYPAPHPTCDWPHDNLPLLEHYRDWLISGGLSAATINQLYVPTAGHVLGLNLNPAAELDLDRDLERALDYVKAKRLSAEWTDNSRIALDKFRQFLRQQRGQFEIVLRPSGRAHYLAGLPAWLVEQLERYEHLVQTHWRPERSKESRIDSSLAPPGYHIATAYGFYFPCEAAKDKRGKLRDQMAEKIIDHIGVHPPNIRSLIVDQAIFSSSLRQHAGCH